MERTNARHLESLPDPVSLIVGDLSFISLSKILPAVQRLAGTGTEAVLLIKPQFEVGKDFIAKGGVVKDEAARAESILRVQQDAETMGARVLGVMDSPVPGAKKGNIEALIHLVVKP